MISALLKNNLFVSCAIKKVIFLTAFVLLLSACAEKTTKEVDITPELDLFAPVRTALYNQFNEWRSVNYRLGGLSKAGVDCSGFVYLTYRDLFGVILPRTARRQASSGVTVAASQLKSGDLVFFKTGSRQNHVGIYLERRQFLHVSTRKGVIISSLDNSYWLKKYWKAVRVLNV